MASQGVQAWDRYAFVNNNPVRYTDPTGHRVDEGTGGSGGGCSLPGCERKDPEPPPPYKPTETPRYSQLSLDGFLKIPETPTPQGTILRSDKPDHVNPIRPDSLPQSDSIGIDYQVSIDWAKVDEIDAVIDGVGLLVNVAEYIFPQAIIVGVIVEGVGTIKSTTELISGDPQSMLLQQTTTTTERVVIMIFTAERILRYSRA